MKWLKKLLGKKYEIDNLNVKKEIYYWFRQNKKMDESQLYHITDVKVYKKYNRKIIKIFTHLPGHFIGKDGRQSFLLMRWLKNVFGKNTKIEILESKLWKLYN